MDLCWNSSCIGSSHVTVQFVLSSKYILLFTFPATTYDIVFPKKHDNYILRSFLFQKSLTIFNSALYGGAVVATGVDYFVENSIMLMWVWDKVRAKESEDYPCWFSWAILMIWPLLLILGK